MVLAGVAGIIDDGLPGRTARHQAAKNENYKKDHRTGKNRPSARAPVASSSMSSMHIEDRGLPGAVHAHMPPRGCKR